MKPAGFDNSQGVITAAYQKDPTDKRWDDDADMKTWREWMAKYQPSGNTGDANYIYAYGVSYLMTETLKRCGGELTRANVMKQAAGFQKFKVPILLPGITINTSATDFYPIQSVQLQRFKGETWDLFGDVMSAEGS
jgi:branched-chain amino acid transport system substrate-binding protein